MAPSREHAKSQAPDRKGEPLHELSICSAIADAVNEHAEGRPVERERLRIGHFKQIIPETLQYCWSLQSDDSPLKNTALDVTYVEAVIRCDVCATETTLSVPVLVCEACIELSARTGDGVDQWIDWLRTAQFGAAFDL